MEPQAQAGPDREDGVTPVPVLVASALAGVAWMSNFGHGPKHTLGPGSAPVAPHAR